MFISQKCPSESRPVWYVFAGMGTQWHGMGRDLMVVESFKQSIMKSDAVLRKYGVNLFEMLMQGDENTFDNTMNSFIGIAAIQVVYIVFELYFCCSNTVINFKQ